MEIAAWSAVVGLLLIVMALGDSLLARLPLSTSMLYLAVGAAVSPLWLGWTSIAAGTQTKALEQLAEIVVLLSLFGSGLKMSAGLSDGRWLLPLRLAILSMLVTVALVAGVGVLALGLPLGAAILLGGILAPTDPVLASDVQVADPGDRDRLRFALTGEAGLNDGTAFPLVMLGLGLLGLHDIGSFGWRWLAVDVLWAVTAGVAIGAVLGTAVGQLVLYLRRTHKEAVGLDNFLALGLVGLAYGAADLAHGYGFLAVFAAGVALRRLEQQASAQAAGRRAGRRSAAREPARRRRSAEVAAAGPCRPRRIACRAGGDRSEARAGVHGARDARLQRADRAHRRGRRGDRGGHAALGGRVAARLVGLRRRAAARDPAGLGRGRPDRLDHLGARSAA